MRLVSRSGSEVPPLHSAMGGTGHSILGEQIPSSTPKRTVFALQSLGAFVLECGVHVLELG